MTGHLFEPPAFTEHFIKSPPDILYHYTGQLGLLGIVSNAELWATKIQYMNDASEFGLALRLARQWLEHVIDYSEHSSEKLAAHGLMETLNGLEDINIFTICFCENGDLLSQWRGYASEKYGYSIGFDSEALMHIANHHQFILGRCIYDRSVQQTIIEQAVAHCVSSELTYPVQSRWGFHGPLADILFRCGVFFKDSSFEDEREWRLVSPTIRYDSDRLHFRTGHSTITPYYVLPIMNDGRLPIEQVIVGPCPHMNLAASSVTSLLMSRGNRDPLSGRQVALPSTIPFRNW